MFITIESVGSKFDDVIVTSFTSDVPIVILL